MRVTIPHSKNKAEVIQAVDRAMQDVFQSMAIPPLTISHPQKTWNGPVMTFSLVAQMGFLRNTICGTVEVTDRDFTIDADLGLLNRVFPEQKVRTMIESRVRGLLTPPVKN
ncbi:MAG TPA: polyhydroxyalkanoic acid system family protein [Bryobacteraceae bacterium]